MILIITDNNINNSIEEVIDWMDFYFIKYKRIRGESFFNEDQNLFFNLNKNLKGENSQNVKKIWYRGFIDHSVFLDKILKNIETNNNFNLALLSMRSIYEISMITNFFLRDFKEKTFPSISDVSTNKLDVLINAKEFRIKIPNTIITNNKKKLNLFLKQNRFRIITKSMYENLNFQDNNFLYEFKTKILTQEDLNKYPDFFFPSFFQQYIEKKYEIRSFFIDNNFYSMAIFSQNSSKTMEDFRNYDKVNPNRTVPYKLPIKTENKLRMLMNKLNLDTGSIDLIKGINNEYYFLEVNPFGQFGMVSHPCNYFLEEKICLYLNK